jgi:hypothetical protein
LWSSLANRKARHRGRPPAQTDAGTLSSQREDGRAWNDFSFGQKLT